MNPKLVKIMSDVLEVPEGKISNQSSMENTDTWDSLKHMELVMAVEELFGVEFESDELMSMTSYADIVKILESKKY